MLKYHVSCPRFYYRMATAMGALILAVSVASCNRGSDAEDPRDSPHVRAAKKWVVSNLTIKENVKFRNIDVYESDLLGVVVCGEVRSKTPDGDYLDWFKFSAQPESDWGYFPGYSRIPSYSRRDRAHWERYNALCSAAPEHFFPRK